MSEFDAFGPWILRVNTEEEIPRLFREAVDLSSTRLVLKIPRKIERRQASPLMDLYDRLLVVRDQGLEVLTRTPGTWPGRQSTGAVWRDLVAIEESTALLDGRLRLCLASGSVIEVPFNAVSEDLIAALVNEVRDYWNPSVKAGAGAPLRLDALDLSDVDLVNYFNLLQTRVGDLQPKYIRPRYLVTREGGAEARLMDRLHPRLLHAAIIGMSGKDLLVVHRRESGLEGLRATHSLALTVMPLSRLSIVKSSVPTWRNVSQLRLTPTPITFYAQEGDGFEDALGQW